MDLVLGGRFPWHGLRQWRFQRRSLPAFQRQTHSGTGTKPPRDLYCKDAFWTVDIRQTWARDHPAPTPTWLVVHRILRARAGPGIPRIVRLRAAFRAAGMQRFQHSCLLGYSLSLHGVFSRPSLASPKIQRHSGRPCCLLSASVRYMKLKLSGSSS